MIRTLVIALALALFAGAPLPAQTTGWINSPTLKGAYAIPSEFDPTLALHTAAIPPDGGVDPVGALRFICGAGQLLYDDPLVFPRQPGKSHLHQFYGNTSANANSTFGTLRRGGQSTCNNGTYAVNRSSYWMPAMLDGKGNVVQPDYVSIYYKRYPATDPHCGDPSNVAAHAQGICVGIPNALRMIWGYDMVTNTPPTGHFHFACVQGSTPITDSQDFATAVDGCPAGDRVEAMITAPACWDGKHLDSPNHRDHVAYPSYGSWGYARCPADHPYLMPAFTMGVFYMIGAGDDVTKWDFSSAAMHPELPRGATFHADYFEGWDSSVKTMWTAKGCIDKHLSCVSGNLGNGYQLKGAYALTITNPNRLVPVPAHR